jgi:hypothetical protein
MTLSFGTFEYLRPTDDQMEHMTVMRDAAANYAAFVETHVPDGPDRTYLLRKFREVAMWVNVAITRDAEGKPRSQG